MAENSNSSHQLTNNNSSNSSSNNNNIRHEDQSNIAELETAQVQFEGNGIGYKKKKRRQLADGGSQWLNDVPDTAMLSFKKKLSAAWLSYKNFIRKNEMTLNFADEALTRALFWAPHGSDSDSDLDAETADKSRRHGWREVFYGLLSLNRLAMDVAFHDTIENDYGMTLRPSQPPHIPATALRISLNIVHGIVPALLELFRSRQAMRRVRIYSERIKFLLRMVLIVTYWRQIRRDQERQEQQEHEYNDNRYNTKRSYPPLIGIMQAGGMFYDSNCCTPTITQDYALRQRREYRGRRTGRRVVRDEANDATNVSTSPYLVLLAEIIHSYRPLFWANVEGTLSYKAWLFSFAMDIISLQCLWRLKKTTGNILTIEEWERRRKKLRLYMLRSPVWDNFTLPCAERVGAVLLRFPIFGMLMDTYLWDWLSYWRHPYVSEEG